jgi:hypothetical protein
LINFGLFGLFGLSDLEKWKPNQITKTELVKIFNRTKIFKPKNRTKISQGINCQDCQKKNSLSRIPNYILVSKILFNLKKKGTMARLIARITSEHILQYISDRYENWDEDSQWYTYTHFQYILKIFISSTNYTKKGIEIKFNERFCIIHACIKLSWDKVKPCSY